MFVGEKPGDYEDRVGRPFVGPAGRILDRALAEVGIDRRHREYRGFVEDLAKIRPYLRRRRGERQR